MKQIKLRTEGSSMWRNSTEVKMENCMIIRDWRRRKRRRRRRHVEQRRILARR